MSGTAVRITGVLDGVNVEADAVLRVLPAGVSVALRGGDVMLSYDALDGATRDGDALVILGRDGTRLTVSGLADSDAISREIIGHGCVVPEVLRSLRGFASVESLAGSDHAAFFAPLLVARRRAHEATSAAERVNTFAAGALVPAIEAAMDALALKHYPGTRRAAERRALGAELEELTAPVERALAALDDAADAVRSASSAEVLRAWHTWGATLAVVFEAADTAWEHAMPALTDTRGAKGAFWRRVLRRGA